MPPAPSREQIAPVSSRSSHTLSRVAVPARQFLLEVDAPEAERCAGRRLYPRPCGLVQQACAAVLCRSGDMAVTREYLNGRILREMTTDWNYHTPLLDVNRSWLQEQLSGIRTLPASIPIYSSAAGGRITRAPAFDAAFFAWMVSRPFRFADAVSAALADGFGTIINIGPHPSNNAHLSAIAAAFPRPVRLTNRATNDEQIGERALACPTAHTERRPACGGHLN